MLVLKKLETGWWDGVINAERGWFPSNFVSSPEMTIIKPRKSFGWVRRRTRDNVIVYHNVLTGETLTSTDDKQSGSGSGSSDDEKSFSHSPILETTPAVLESNESNLPLHWGCKITPSGRNYYYNMLTNETTWNLDDIDLETGKLKSHTVSLSPKSLNIDVEDFDSIPRSEWDRMKTYVMKDIQELKKNAQSREKAKYLDSAAKVVLSIQTMFISSNTLEKDSPILKSHKMLGIHHRHILKSLSKVVLSAKQAAGIWPPPDAPSTLCNDANEVLLAVRHFTSMAEEFGVKVSTPQHASHLEHHDSSKEPSLIDSLTEPTSSQTLIESLDFHPKRIAENVFDLHKNLQSGHHEGSESELIGRTRAIVTEVGQLLSLIDEINVKSLSSEVVAEFEKHRESVYNSIRSLVSAATSAVGPLPNADVHEQLLSFSSSVESAVNDLCIAAKYILEEKDVMEQLKMQENMSDDRSTSDLSLEPRRALSMNHLHQPEDAEDYPRLSSSSEHDLTKSSLSQRFPKLRISGRFSNSTPVSPVASNEDLRAHGFSDGNRSSLGSRYKPRAVSSSAPIPRRVTVSSTRSSKLSKIFGDDVLQASTGPDEWYLGFDHDAKDLILSIDGNVKGATLPALIEKMTYHDSYDTNLTQAFLLTYRSFTSATEFLQLLIDRFTMNPPLGLTENQLLTWNEKKLKPIRLRVFNVIKTWLDSFFIEDDLDLLDDLASFAIQIVRDTMPLASDQLIKLIDKKKAGITSPSRKGALPSPDSCPTPILPRSLKRFRLMDIEPLEMARQITLLESRLYMGISPLECLGKAWSDKEHNRAPNIKAMIDTTNRITSWVAETILLEKDIKKRCAILKYFIMVGDKCRSINNFNALMAILAALNSSPIHRLKRTKELLSSKTRTILDELKSLMAPGQNFSNYRNQLRSVNPPCVPFLGMYLTDLTFIEDGNGNNVKAMPHLINFDKRMKTAEKIREVQQYQAQYQFLDVEELQKFIETSIRSSMKDAEELYQRSQQIEPREREDEKIARLLQESGFL